MMDRRHFLAGAASAAIVNCADRTKAGSNSPNSTGRNLIPQTPCHAPNYWCTWAVQNYMFGHDLRKLDPAILEGESGSKLAHNAMSEAVLFSSNGWAREFFPKIRRDLYLLLDDGWESGGTATFELETSKFPSFQGSAAERLSQLNRAAQEASWRGAALWCRNTPGGAQDSRLEELSRTADIRYWKIDVGDPAFNLIRVRDQKRIPLMLEHVHGELPVNGDWRADGRFGSQPWDSRRMQILAHTDVYRTYDVTSILSLPTTLDRLAEMLKGAQGHPEIHGLLNVEDEVYVAAVMGCTMGILRHPLFGLRPQPDTDLFFNGPRQPKKRMDEVVRALRWQRMAPPVPAGNGTVHVSPDALTDSWVFRRGETWQTDLVGQRVYQGAPACISRNIELPQVTAPGEHPFVFAMRFPNGTVAVGSQERTQPDRGWFMPKSSVALDVGDAAGPFGVFGDFESLTFNFSSQLDNTRILAQDLAGDEACDITRDVQIRGRSLRVPGEIIRRVGLQAATRGDVSSPGLVIAIE
jgi:hypothetical protein